MNSPRNNLLDLDAEALKAYIAGLHEKPFRAKQLLNWVHQRGVGDIALMSDLAKSFRQTLSEQTEVCALPVVSEALATDGTRKWLIRMPSTGPHDKGAEIETVYIPESDRGMIAVPCVFLRKQVVRSIVLFALLDIKVFHGT